jgi:hypothetical protein
MQLITKLQSDGVGTYAAIEQAGKELELKFSNARNIYYKIKNGKDLT